MNDLTLVIPAKNESESLPKVLEELKEYNLKKIVVVPNNDQDTKDAIKNFDCKILDQKGNGFGSALIEGINTVETKFFCIFNADGSFDPKYLSELKNKVLSGQDFVFCSRYEKEGGSEDDTIITYIGNKFFTGFCNLLFKLNLTDVLFTYVMGSTEAFKNLDMKFCDFSFCVELPIKAKLKNYTLGNLPSFERSRIAGIKKVNEFKDGFLILISILRLITLK
ncbi:MAG: hypothetical protein CBB97_00350 [Candidatus Endolissoclinum sp. TMED37]|nr:MAG: hypothetical protein CBB97_00350 [Candidatus Endolissoclinum sp. TMED37]